MARIPIRYDSINIYGDAGGQRAIVGRVVVDTLSRDAAWDEATGLERHIAGLTGIDIGDVGTFRSNCVALGIMIIVRCPGLAAGRTARLLIGVIPKPEDLKGIKVKNDVVAVKGALVVSDYDLMSVWQRVGPAYEKIVFTRKGSGPDQPWISEDAARLFERLNNGLQLPIQHGANDDWDVTGNATYADIKNGAVLGHKHYAAFTETGHWRYLTSPGLLRTFYTDNGLSWPYP